MASLPLNFCSIHRMVTSVGRPYIHDTSPRANMFLARSASFLVMPIPSVARTVIEVIGKGGGGIGEAVSRQLHAIAGVAGGPDDDAFLLDDRLRCHFAPCGERGWVLATATFTVQRDAAFHAQSGRTTTYTWAEGGM